MSTPLSASREAGGVLVRALDGVRAGQLGRARRRVREQAQRQAALGEEPGGHAADVPGRAGDRQGWEGRGLGRLVRVGAGSGGVSHVTSMPLPVLSMRTPYAV